MADDRKEIELGLQEAIIDAIEAGFDKAEVMDMVRSIFDEWNFEVPF